MQASKRIPWLDVLKGLMILFVLLEHSYPAPVYVRIYTPFFLTMFFFASGAAFSTKQSFGEFALGKVRRLLIPLFGLSLIRFVLGYVLGDHDLPGHLLGLCMQISGRMDELWFVACLFTCSMLMYGAVKLYRVRPAMGAGLAAALGLLGYADMLFWQVRLPWQVETACFMLPYMFAGWLLRQSNPMQRLLQAPRTVFLCTAVYAALVALVDPQANIHMQQFGHPAVFWVLTWLAVPPVIALSKLLAETRMRGALVRIGRNTLFLFVFGGFVRIVFYAVTDRLGLHMPLLLSVVCMVLSAAVLLVPAELTRRWLPWLVGGR